MSQIYTTHTNQDSESQPLSTLIKCLKRAKNPPTLVIDGEQIPLSSSLSEAMLQLASLMANDQEVAIVPLKEELTAQQAAKLLGVSRPHLVKLLQTHAIPYTQTGNHYRIAVSDLLAFKQQREKRRAGLNQLTQLMQEEGFYEQPNGEQTEKP